MPGTGAAAKRRFRKAREGEPGAGRRQRAPVFAEIHLHRGVQCSQGRAAALNSKSRLGLSWNDQNIKINSRGSWKCGSDVQGLQSIRSFSTWDVTLDWDPLAVPQGWGGASGINIGVVSTERAATASPGIPLLGFFWNNGQDKGEWF